jgi:Domain of unknown function (DUF4381)
MNPSSSWLSELAPAHAPEAISGWPLAPGWWALLFMVLAGLATAVYYWQHPSRRQYRRALKELKQLEMIQDDTSFAQALEHLLRRYALTRFQREAVAAYSGKKWIAFLVDYGARSFQGDAGQHFLIRCYGGEAPAHREAWSQGAKDFFKGCI